MKMADIPHRAFSTEPTPIPTRIVYDWEQVLAAIDRDGFVIIESDDLRTTKQGGIECIQVKALNSFARTTKNRQLKTKRISHNRWFCTL